MGGHIEPRSLSLFLISKRLERFSEGIDSADFYASSPPLWRCLRLLEVRSREGRGIDWLGESAFLRHAVLSWSAERYASRIYLHNGIDFNGDL